MDKSRVYFVIAAYNEGKLIAKVVQSLKKAGYNNIIVVDDGSADDTFWSAENAGAIALRHVVNRGQGAALQTGMDYALEEGADYIVHFDADGQHRIEDIEPMLRPVMSGNYDISLGSRFIKHKGKDVPYLRRFLLRGSIIVQNLFYGVKLTDAHNGFRVLSRDAATKIRITLDRMAHASEIIEEIKKYNLRYKEVPIKIRYDELTLKKGHGGFIQALKIFYNMLLKRMIDRK